MHEKTVRCLHAGFDLEHFYTGLYNLRLPPTPEELTLDLKVEVKSLRVEVILSRPLPRRSPAAGTWLDEPGEPHSEIQHTD